MKNNDEHLVNGRYTMCKDQPAQIDCRNAACKYHVNASCTNVSPAITLITDVHAIDLRPVLKATCWSFEEKDLTALQKHYEQTDPIPDAYENNKPGL